MRQTTIDQITQLHAAILADSDPAVAKQYSEPCGEAVAALARGDSALAIEKLRAVARDFSRDTSVSSSITLVNYTLRNLEADTFGLAPDQIVPVAARQFLDKKSTEVKFKDEEVVRVELQDLSPDYLSAKWLAFDGKGRKLGILRFEVHGITVEHAFDPRGQSYATTYQRLSSRPQDEKEKRLGYIYGTRDALTRRLSSRGVRWMHHPAQTHVNLLEVLDVVRRARPDDAELREIIRATFCDIKGEDK